jgi:hypothetical protein
MLPISNLEFIAASATDIEVTDMINTNWVKLFISCTNVTMLQAIGLRTSRLVRGPPRKLTDAGSGKERRKKKTRDNRESTWVAHAEYFRI